MAAQVLGHRGERAEEPGEDRLQGSRDRLLIRQVERRRAVVGVDDDLHGVAYVVDAAGRRCGVGILPADGVGVHHPDELPFRDDQIRVVVVSEERSDRRHAVEDVAVVEDHSKGTLHYHLIFFGGLPAYLLQRFIVIREVCKEISKTLDSMFKAKFQKNMLIALRMRKVLQQEKGLGVTEKDMPVLQYPLLNQLNVLQGIVEHQRLQDTME